MKKITIAVVIPTHNRPELLRRAIQSVLDQTVLPDEIIVVDDLNDVATKETCFSLNSNLVRYVPNLEGRGASSSRNLGAISARSEFIAFLDDDDIWLPEKLAKQRKLIEDRGLDLCFSQLLVQYEDTDISYSTTTKNILDPKTEILIENYIGATISAVVRRDLFLSIGGFDESFRAREEYDLWIRLIHEGAKVAVVEESLAVSFRSLEQRNRISLNVDNYISAIEMLNCKHQGLVDRLLSAEQKRLRKRKQFDFIAAQAVSIGLRKEAVQYYFKSLMVRPSIKSLIGVSVSVISPRLLIKLREKLG